MKRWLIVLSAAALALVGGSAGAKSTGAPLGSVAVAVDRYGYGDGDVARLDLWRLGGGFLRSVAPWGQEPEEHFGNQGRYLYARSKGEWLVIAPVAGGRSRVLHGGFVSSKGVDAYAIGQPCPDCHCPPSSPAPPVVVVVGGVRVTLNHQWATARPVAWSDDGRWLAVTVGWEGAMACSEDPKQLWLVNAKNHSARKLDSADRYEGYEIPSVRFSPDGRRLAYIITPFEGQTGSLTLRVAGVQTDPVTAASKDTDEAPATAPARICWSDDSSRLAAALGPEIVAANADGTHPRILLTAPAPRLAGCSRHGGAIAYWDSLPHSILAGPKVHSIHILALDGTRTNVPMPQPKGGKISEVIVHLDRD